MSLKKFFTKKLQIPVSNETKQIDVIQLWEVRWYGLDHYKFGTPIPCMEAFTSEDEAIQFKTSLEKAFDLLKIKNDAFYAEFRKVTLKKSD